jgi:hypothetical protein
MKKLLFALLLAAPMLFTSCSKEETKIVSPFNNIEFDKRLAVTKSDLVKYQVIRNLNNNKYQFIVFKNNTAGVLVTDMNSNPEKYLYSTQWDVSGGNLTIVSEKGDTSTFAIEKEYKRSGDSYSITVYLKDETGEYAYDAVDDGGNYVVAANIWNIIDTVRKAKQ